MRSKIVKTLTALLVGIGLSGLAAANTIVNETTIDDFLDNQSTGTTFAPGSNPGEWDDPFSTGYDRELLLSAGIAGGAINFSFEDSFAGRVNYSGAVVDLSAFDVFYFDVFAVAPRNQLLDILIVAGSDTYTIQNGGSSDLLSGLGQGSERRYFSFSEFDDLAVLFGNDPINWEEISRIQFNGRSVGLDEWGVASFDTLAVIPVPPTAALMLIGLAGLGLRRKRMAAKQ